ncbi:MAG TPA: hypothetical protein VGW78_07515 [Candidatus Babeliales bacterium]|jgi:hypothetical protein|nr:hypothetical protein [Candidatus Babeliales bacterium]
MQSAATPQILNDLYLNFGTDLLPSAIGDIQTVSGSTRSQQRVLRRLLTQPGSYIWHPTYGAGLPGFVGQPLSQDNYQQMKSLIISNMFLEESVSQTVQPVIAMQPLPDGIFIQINYTENPTLAPIVLSFDLTSNGVTVYPS